MRRLLACCFVATGAARLYLGFADGYLCVGHPGWYGNNDGALSVSVKVRRPR